MILQRVLTSQSALAVILKEIYLETIIFVLLMLDIEYPKIYSSFEKSYQ
jgi:hypothetical protein